MVNLPSVSLKVIVITHFILTVWASMAGSFLPTSYIYMNAFILAMGVWGIVSPESSEAVLMFLIMNLCSVLLDIIFLGIYNPRAHALYETGILRSQVDEYRFCLGMSIVNLIIKPFTCFVLYRVFQERGGHYGDLNIPGLQNFGVAGSGGGGGSGGSRGYENIDRQVESAAPHDFKGGPTESPQ